LLMGSLLGETWGKPAKKRNEGYSPTKVGIPKTRREEVITGLVKKYKRKPGGNMHGGG